jgi:hypothetical protein
MILSSGLFNLYPTASGSFEIPVNFCQARQCHNPADSILHTWDNGNLTPHRQCSASTKIAQNMCTIAQLC